MPLKAVLVVSVLAIVIILGLLGMQSNINIAKLNKQLIKWYKEIIT